MSTAIAATTTNTAAVETAAKIYHGVRVLLDIISVNEETALLLLKSQTGAEVVAFLPMISSKSWTVVYLPEDAKGGKIETGQLHEGYT